MPKFHDRAISYMHQDITLVIYPEPTSGAGGKPISGKGTEYTVRGAFRQLAFRLVPTPNGDMVHVDAEIQVAKARLDALGITPCVYLTKAKFLGRSYTVLAMEDYSHIDGMFRLYLTAEADTRAYRGS